MKTYATAVANIGIVAAEQPVLRRYLQQKIRNQTIVVEVQTMDIAMTEVAKKKRNKLYECTISKGNIKGNGMQPNAYVHLARFGG